jgi:hypothetical protein
MLSLKKLLLLLFSSIQVYSFAQLDTIKTDLNEILKAAVRCQKIIKNFIDYWKTKKISVKTLRHYLHHFNTLIHFILSKL